MSKKQPEPDYKALFEQSLYHLRVMCGSRNSFSPEAVDRLLHPKDPDAPAINWRTPAVEQMHQQANQFLKLHDK